MTPAAPKSRRVSFRFSEADIRMLKALAREINEAQAVVIRRALYEYMRRRRR